MSRELGEVHWCKDDGRVNPPLLASAELGNVVKQASDQLQTNISLLSDEIHDQRRVTKDDIKLLIDYATERIGKTIDDRIGVAKQELSLLVNEKVAHLRSELEDAAVQSQNPILQLVGFHLDRRRHGCHWPGVPQDQLERARRIFVVPRAFIF